MSNVVINLISRVEADKNYFIDILFVIYELRKEYGIEVKLNIVGKIYNNPIHQTLMRFAKCAKIEDLVYFTNESIPFSTLKKRENEYFLNFSVGNFVGYSTIESVRNELHTILYNVDTRYQQQLSGTIIFSYNHKQFKNLLLELDKDEETIRKRIAQENQALKQSFVIDSSTAEKLLDLIRL